jgi:hypothetical protein
MSFFEWFRKLEIDERRCRIGIEVGNFAFVSPTLLGSLLTTKLVVAISTMSNKIV